MGVLLVVRWCVLKWFTDDVASRVPSLVAAAVCFVFAALVAMVGLLADLLSVNRRMIAEVRLSLRRRDLDDAARPIE